MRYEHTAIADSEIPRAKGPIFQHLLDTYASEINKVVSTWLEFKGLNLDFKPHPRSSTVREVMKHQLLSERRFFGEFLGTPEPKPEEVLPESMDVDPCCARLVELAIARL